MDPVGYEWPPPLQRRKERVHFVEDSPLVMRAVVAQNVDLLTIQNLSHKSLGIKLITLWIR